MIESSTRADRNHLEILPLAECLALIDETPLGRVAFTVADQPIVLPVNHTRDGMQIAFRSAPGAKLEAVRTVARVAFEVDCFDAEERTGWSVLGQGSARLANDIEASHLEAHGLTPWADGVPRRHWIVIDLTHVSGRRVVH